MIAVALRLDSPHWLAGVALVALYVVAAGTAGGIIIGAYTSPPYGVLIVSRWNADGSIDSTFGTNGSQEAGFSPERVEFHPVGVLPLSGTQLVVYGEAGHTETLTHSVGGTTYSTTVIRRKEPAVFRVAHPGGIDAAFGQQGAEILQIQEFQADVLAARILPPQIRRAPTRLRFVCTDRQNQPLPPKYPTSTFGGIGQFLFPRRLPFPP